MFTALGFTIHSELVSYRQQLIPERRTSAIASDFGFV
jgi:hypothetical protein